jgi:hypothetical protein
MNRSSRTTIVERTIVDRTNRADCAQGINDSLGAMRSLLVKIVDLGLKMGISKSDRSAT